MALHGTIQINSETIGVWAAQRRPDVGRDSPGEGNVYDCEVLYKQQGMTDFEKVAVTVEHNYADGALALAATLLSAAEDVRKANTA